MSAYQQLWELSPDIAAPARVPPRGLAGTEMVETGNPFAPQRSRCADFFSAERAADSPIAQLKA